MKNKILTKFVGALVCASSLALALHAGAISLDTSSPYYLGSITPNTPSNPANEADYIDVLRGLGLNASASSGANTIVRSGNSFGVGVLVDATAVGAAKDDTSPSNTIDISSGWTYLLAKYGSGNDSVGAFVWVVSGLSGTVDVPSARLSHWSLYNPTGGDNNRVPDGGSTLLILGAGLALLGVARRRA